MSQANASARKRRAPPPVITAPVSTPPQFQQQPQNTGPSMNSGNGLTLPQVILLVDKRLTVLEKFMNTTNQFNETQHQTVSQPVESSDSDEVNEIKEEFNIRYSLLAEEIGNIKNMLLSLQTYTMEVNKKLLEQQFSNSPEITTSTEEITLETTVDLSSEFNTLQNTDESTSIIIADKTNKQSKGKKTINLSS